MLRKKIAYLGYILIFLMGFSITSATDANPPADRNTADGVVARYCDTDSEATGTLKSLKLPVAPGKPSKICVDIFNKLNEDTQIHVGIVDGMKDQEMGTLSCDYELAGASFGQYVTGFVNVYSIPANSKKRIFPIITMPKSAAGTIYGCVTIYNETIFQEKLKDGGLTTLVRNTIPIELFVDSKVAVGLELAGVKDIAGDNMLNDPVFVTKQADGSYLVAVGFKNTGGLDEAVEVAGTIKDVLGKVIELAPQTKTVGPDGYGDVRFAIPKLPRYQMWFTVDLTVTHNAVSEFRTEFITEKLLEKKTLTVQDTFFVFPWWIVAALVLLILIIMGIRRMIKKAHAHHQQEIEAMQQLKELQKWKQEHDGTSTPQA